MRFPLAGVDKRAAFQSQPPYSSPAALNCTGDDAITGRARGGSRPGLSKSLTTDRAGPYQFLDVVNVDVGDGENSYTRLVVGCTNGYLLRKTEGAATWTEVSGGPHVNPSVQLSVAKREQKLFIADYSNVNGTDGAMTGGIFTSATYPNWETAGITASNVTQWRLSITTAGVDAFYSISAVSGSNLTITSPPANNTGLTYALHRTPKVWNLATDTVAVWTTDDYVAGEVGVVGEEKGTVPTGCSIICEYQDRMVLAGHVRDPHVWFSSRSGDPYDFDYGIADRTSAVASSNYLGGQIGEPIQALIPHGYDCLIMGAQDAIYVMRGNPANTSSQLVKVDDVVGVLSANAWCKTPADETILLTRDGLYYMPSGCGVPPTSISREKLPLELIGLTPSSYYINLAYDVLLRCVHIWTIPVPSSGNPTQTTCWLFNWEHKAFWPINFPAAMQPTALCDYPPLGTATDSSVLLGGYDGIVRQFDKEAYTDDGTEFLAYFDTLFMLSPNTELKGVIQRMRVTMGEDSGPATWELTTGNTAEEAVNKMARGEAFNTGNVDGYAAYPRGSGHYACLRISTFDSTQQFVYENTVAQVREAGRMRY